MGGVVGFGEEAQVDLVIEGFDEAALGFGLAGVVGDLGEMARGFLGTEDGGDGPVGAAGGVEVQLGIGREETGHEDLQAGFVGHADEHALDLDPVIDVFDDVDHDGSLFARRWSRRGWDAPHHTRQRGSVKGSGSDVQFARQVV